tara:strand:+ start:612 stop:848 length:237 start_codon:yes stop_codon:yes gene_type:complete
MTPQEINEYKLRWMGSSPYSVRLHSDLDTQGKTWCRRNLERHQWKMNTWTNVYEHTFYFEHQDDSLIFETLWPEYTNQ